MINLLGRLRPPTSCTSSCSPTCRAFNSEKSVDATNCREIDKSPSSSTAPDRPAANPPSQSPAGDPAREQLPPSPTDVSRDFGRGDRLANTSSEEPSGVRRRFPRSPGEANCVVRSASLVGAPPTSWEGVSKAGHGEAFTPPRSEESRAGPAAKGPALRPRRPCYTQVKAHVDGFRTDDCSPRSGPTCLRRRAPGETCSASTRAQPPAWARSPTPHYTGVSVSRCAAGSWNHVQRGHGRAALLVGHHNQTVWSVPVRGTKISELSGLLTRGTRTRMLRFHELVAFSTPPQQPSSRARRSHRRAQLVRTTGRGGSTRRSTFWRTRMPPA